MSSAPLAAFPPRAERLLRSGLLGISPGSRAAPTLASPHAIPTFGESRAKALPIGIRCIDEALPEAGLPRGAVVEIAAPRGLARATTLALGACASAQSAARLRAGASATGAWCAWIEPVATLFAPAVARAGVDLARLLVVRPTFDVLGRVAVRVAASRAFSVVVVDIASVPGSRSDAMAGAQNGRAAPIAGTSMDRWTTTVRRLALAIEGSDTTVVLLTDRHAARSMPLPTAMRLELDRPSEDALSLRIAKERRGRIMAPVRIPLPRSA